MSTAANLPPVRFMARRELEFVPRQGARGREWVVSDPIRGEFYVLDRNEFQILQLLRIPKTLEQLAESIRGLLPPSIQLEDLRQFVGRLWDENLIRVDQLGMGARLWSMKESLRKRRSRLAIFSLLSIRLPGINPTAILDGLAPLGRCLFHPLTLIAVLLAALLTTSIAVLSIASVMQKTPAWESFTSPAFLGAMLVAFIVVKVLHELGHGMASRVYGGNCSEMGLLLLVFLPCLYCDVSETWKQPNRFRRAMVALAGVYVEVIIATACFWAWYLSAPGFLHTCFFSLMIITSVNTLLINGNPLLRYDGYYFLSDIADVPNQSQVAQQHLTRAVRSFFFHDRDPFQDVQRVPAWQVVYAILSTCYRYSILIAILWAISRFFHLRNLAYVGQVFTGAIGLILVIPLAAAVLRLAPVFTQSGKRWGRWLLAIALVVASGFVVAGIPVHYRVVGTAHFYVRDAELVYAQGTGQLIPRVVFGQTVEPDQQIAEIVNRDLATQEIVQRGLYREAQQRLGDLKIQQSLGAKTEAEIEFWQAKIESLRNELQEWDRLNQQLAVKINRGGTVINAVEPGEQATDPKFFDAAMIGKGVQRGDLLCVVGDPSQLIGYVAVPQTQIEMVREGDSVKVFAPQGTTGWGTVQDVSVSSRDVAPRGNGISGIPESDYIVEIHFKDSPPGMHGSTSTAAILGRRMTILEIVVRHIRAAFFW